jgi:hypothetical protein
MKKMETKQSRRDFLKYALATSGTTALAGCALNQPTYETNANRLRENGFGNEDFDFSEYAVKIGEERYVFFPRGDEFSTTTKTGTSWTYTPITDSEKDKFLPYVAVPLSKIAFTIDSKNRKTHIGWTGSEEHAIKDANAAYLFKIESGKSLVQTNIRSGPIETSDDFISRITEPDFGVKYLVIDEKDKANSEDPVYGTGIDGSKIVLLEDPITRPNYNRGTDGHGLLDIVSRPKKVFSSLEGIVKPVDLTQMVKAKMVSPTDVVVTR